MQVKRRAEDILEPTTAPKKIDKFRSSDPEFRALLESIGVSYPIWDSSQPSNMEELVNYLSRGWPGMEQEVTRDMFNKFIQRNFDAPTEATVDESVRDILGPDGFESGEGSSSARNLRLVRMQVLRDELSTPQPDFQEGTSKESLDISVRRRLQGFIDLSRRAKAPCMPNFFLEWKGNTGEPWVVLNQVAHDSVVGARGIVELERLLRGEVAPHDGRAIAFAATFISLGNRLELYCVHRQAESQYMVTKLGSWGLDNPRAFCEGVGWVRHARRRAAEIRSELVEEARDYLYTQVLDNAAALEEDLTPKPPGFKNRQIAGRKRGRPRRQDQAPAAAAKRGRGRPPKCKNT